MKTLNLLLLLTSVVLLFIPCHADPFLVCDALDPSLEIQGFKGTVNGQTFDVPYSLHASGKAVIYDCASLPNNQAWDFTNLRAYNVRGEGSGVDFFYPAPPPTLTTLEVKP